MNLLDSEVYAVINAVIVVVSIFSAASLLRTSDTESFTAIGVLNQNCEIGDYPEQVYNNESIHLCLFVDNHNGYTTLFRVKYKIGSNDTLPTDEAPSPKQAVAQWDFLLNNIENLTYEVTVHIAIDLNNTLSRRVAIIFELWYLDPVTGQWKYTGRWVHKYLLVKKRVLGEEYGW